MLNRDSLTEIAEKLLDSMLKHAYGSAHVE